MLAKAGLTRVLFIGRWVLYMARGTLRHAAIAKNPPVRGERPLTPIALYAIGIALGAFYLTALGWFGLGVPTLWTAAGHGFFGLRGQPRDFLLRQSLVNHFFFGIGLWLGSLLL